MTRSRKGGRGPRRGRQGGRQGHGDAGRENSPAGERGQGPPRRGQGPPRRPAEAKRADPAAAESASRVAARQARTRPLRQLLEGIGTPDPAPFKPDPFQLEALAALEREDVLVTAPTGSGKTWIAREEIRRLLDAGKRAWYTSPLKALTNSKYHEFTAEFGEGRVGILTGDRKEKSDAPLIVGTTEVYRNQLFDALRGGHQLQADLVILDEAHYLSDQERGHVWEEAIILTPPRVRMLLLSATVGRSAEFADWIAEVRGTHVRVVERPGARPVPLRAAFLFPDGGLTPLLDERDHFNAEIARFMQTAKSERQSPPPRFGGGRGGGPTRRPGLPEMPPSILLAALGSYDLLPAIVFLPTRRRCDEAAAEAAFAPRRGSGDPARREARREILNRLVEQYPEVRRHRHWDTVLRGGVASHHAGHLPAWKLLIERLMSEGLLDAIFATATVAAGVDFPARTVVLENMDVRTGNGWRPLSASELQQMTGRAGRRGRDRVGFVVAAPGLHQNPQKLASLLSADPDPLESRFRATYTTLLNLLDAYGTFAQVRDIAERSFARRDDAAEVARLERAREEASRRMKAKLEEAGCSLPADVARGLERLTSARQRLLEDAPQTRADAYMRWLDEEVVPGRVVSVGRGSRRLVFVMERRGDGLAGIRDNGRRVTLALERVGRVYEEVHPLNPKSADAAFEQVQVGLATPLQEPRLRDARAPAQEAVDLINDLIDSLSASGGDRARCEEALWAVMEEAETIERMERRMEAVRGESWQPFERRARVLHHFGYLDFFAERVTEPGRWLADLRLDRPLLVGEALGRDLFSSLDAPRAAGLMAALAADAERDYGELELDDALITALAKFDRIAYDVASVEWQQEIEPAPEINFSAAATAARWAAGLDWPTLVRQTRAEEGDLFRMLSRTGESLLQIANLQDSHPEAARIASAAASAVLREPVRSEAAV
ncbi:MAG TPA: DEAD/DEAH box helicase [Pyrinomonadaceae bacterium]|jgi:superfamily II RNA helicase|nr:DEAD/DEAH box helicase [Pyrinomonadaceae bacterium]